MIDAKINKKFPYWIVLLIIIVLWGIALWIAPDEKTLKSGIKPVYVHVALTWMGMLSLSFSAILGIIGLFTKNEKYYRWVYIIFGASIGIYVMGYFASMVSSYINWGGVPFQEPRYISSLNVIIASVMAAGLMFFVPWERVKSALAAFPAVFIVWAMETDRMVLHPDTAVETAPLSIRLSFYSMFFFALLFYIWWVFYIEQRTRKTKLQ